MSLGRKEVRLAWRGIKITCEERLRSGARSECAPPRHDPEWIRWEEKGSERLEVAHQPSDRLIDVSKSRYRIGAVSISKVSPDLTEEF